MIILPILKWTNLFRDYFKQGLMDHRKIFDRLWKLYTDQNPAAQRIYDLFTKERETIVNDHVAFRTFDHPSTGIDVISGIFEASGYTFKGEYHFREKKLFARHFEHTSDALAPRVFISQLLVSEFSPFLQETVLKWTNAIPKGILKSPELIFSGNPAGIPSYRIFEQLRTESEYAAWLYVNGFCANHFTVSVNHLKKYGTLQKVNDFLKTNGFLMNDAGGEIQGSPAELLEQSSTRADIIRTGFREGIFEVPGCYYEFAKRYPDKDGHLYSGFIAKSADKIFQSTDFYKK